MNKDQFANLVNSQINDGEASAKPQAQVLASAYLDQIAGGNGPGFINGYFNSFSQSQPGGGSSFDKIVVPGDDSGRLY